MNILFISAVMPYPLFSGGQVRIYNLLKLLSKKHSITLYSFIRNKQEQTYKKNLSFLTKVELVHRGRALQPVYMLKALGKYPLLLASYDNSEMKRRITEELASGNYDLVHIEPFYVYPSLPDISIPWVVGEHNIEYSVYDNFASAYPVAFLRQAVRNDAKKIKRWEETVWKRAAVVTSVSREDSVIIAKTTGKPSPVISNGVDTDWFTFKPRILNRKKPTFLFVGNFAWVPNIEAVRTLLTEIWPGVLQKFPSATLTVVGKHFPTALRDTGRHSVFIHEDIEDVREVFWYSDVLLAPMGIAGGSKFKILEAMASGTLVVTTPSGYSGLTAVPGRHLVEAGTARQFITAVDMIFRDTKETKKMLTQARTLVEETYDWKVIAGELDNVWSKSL